ncbi:MAG: hypothetical protein Q7S74_00425, partial [Nanoarchaeota archaeon]|nr:hypothetical protein [Nanoarchaeota archaeon]
NKGFKGGILSFSMVWEAHRKDKRAIFENRYFKVNPQIVDPLIARGETLKVIREFAGCSGEAIRSYIHNNDMYEDWRSSKQAINTSRGKHLLREISSLVLWGVFANAKKSGNEINARNIERAIIHWFNPNAKVPFDAIVDFLDRYELHKSQGRMTSLVELTKGLRISVMAASVVLKKFNEEPLNGSIQIHRLKEEEILAVKRGTVIRMPATDIAYFTGLPDYVVSAYFSSDKLKEVRKRYVDNGLSTSLSNILRPVIFPKLTYRSASQFYESKDAGFSDIEARQYIYSSFCNWLAEDDVITLVDNREEISKKIIDALAILHLNPDIDRPYLDSYKVKNNNV